MKNRIAYMTLGAVICVGMIAGCGTNIDSDTNMVYVDKKGAVTSVDVEVLDADYYNEEELKEFINDEVTVYTQEHGKKSVKVDSITVQDQNAKLIMKYETTDDYTDFNGIDLYQGKVVKALAEGYDFNADFYSVEEGSVSGNASRDDIYAADDLKVVIIKANTDVQVDGTICYVSGENVMLTGANSVSIREGYSLGETGDMSVEEISGTSAANTQTEENTDTAFEPVDSFETDIYTYIIYK